MTVASCLALPERPGPARAGLLLGLGRLLRQPGLVSFVLAAGLIQASHVVYYGFATLHWRAAGHGEAVIGWLWAEGVVAEITVRAGRPRCCDGCRRCGCWRSPAALSVLRWAATALSTDLAVLIPAQALHAASFGAVHLATVHYLRATRRSRCRRARRGSMPRSAVPCSRGCDTGRAAGSMAAPAAKPSGRWPRSRSPARSPRSA